MDEAEWLTDEEPTKMRFFIPTATDSGLLMPLAMTCGPLSWAPKVDADTNDATRRRSLCFMREILMQVAARCAKKIWIHIPQRFISSCVTPSWSQMRATTKLIRSSSDCGLL